MLQEGVAETIKSLRLAGIQVWLLTGDKRETAENIARSCDLFTPEMHIESVESEQDLDRAERIALDRPLGILLHNTALQLAKLADGRLVALLER